MTVTNQNEDIIAMVTTYDKASTNEFEAQAIGGNSGGAVFHNFGAAANPDWQLVGIINAIATYEDQAASWAVYGNATIFANLSYYFHANPAQDYTHSISDIMRSHADYSTMGDVNLNGTVSGDGTGLGNVDDISAFVAGWGFDNGLGYGTVDSWKMGDLNRDGKTDVQDFLKLRRAFNEEIPGSVVTLLFGPGGGPGTPGFVPEPSAAFLIAAGAALFALGVRRRRP
jgi:hypothetical protein